MPDDPFWDTPVGDDEVDIGGGGTAVDDPNGTGEYPHPVPLAGPDEQPRTHPDDPVGAPD